MTLLSRRESILLLGSAAMASGGAWAADAWIEGKHYIKVPHPQPQKPGVVTVTEIFSYGCPACDRFLPYMQSLEKKLPATVVVDYLPASWQSAENWPTFQRAYLTARALGVDRKTHAAMFSEIWHGGKLAVVDAAGRLRSPLPSIQDVAKFYERVAAVPAAKFVDTAKSFSVESEMKRADSLIQTYQADSTPTLIVNGKYRIDMRSAGGGPEQVTALVLWLVQNAVAGR